MTPRVRPPRDPPRAAPMMAGMSTDTPTHVEADPPGTARLLEVIFPGHTNHLGTAFGGHILSLMDKAAAFAAGRYARSPGVVTASFDRVDFRVPIRSGDILEVVGRVEAVGRTSMRVRVDVLKEDRLTRARTLATTGTVTMVAIGEDGRPAPVPPFGPR